MATMCKRPAFALRATAGGLRLRLAGFGGQACYAVTSHDGQTAGPHSRGGSKGALRCGRDEVPVRRGARSARRLFQLFLLVVAHDGRLPRSQHLGAAERPARVHLRRRLSHAVSRGRRLRARPARSPLRSRRGPARIRAEKRRFPSRVHGERPPSVRQASRIAKARPSASSISTALSKDVRGAA